MPTTCSQNSTLHAFPINRLTSPLTMNATPPSADAETETDEHGGNDHSSIAEPHDLVDGTTPLVVHPRGGAREVGRSCYQVETPDGTYLVDCGLNQGSGGQFPDLRGLDSETIDAVFLTHAHIDHTGGLPVLEHRNLLAPDAKIICTQATAALTHLLLHDSLKIHLEESEKPGREQHFDRSDVENVLSRFDAITGYGSGAIADHVATDDGLTYRFGDAGHLLGSAWLSLNIGGRRVVFSGDLGGRSAHLHDIEVPPSADTLILESTYGDRDNHPSFRDARTSLYEQSIEAIQQGIPVLIPTFAVGRVQEILQIFRERWRSLDEETRADFQLIYDGLATQATDRYHAFAGPEYINESVMNYMQNAADFEPFVPEIAQRPGSSDDRDRLLGADTTPIIVSPSGMLTGGLSPAYLHDLLTHYEEMRLIFTGYQAEGTLGREILDADDIARIGIETRPIRQKPGGSGADSSTDPDDSNADTESGTESESAVHGDDKFSMFEHDLPTDWTRSIRGMSGHAARNDLLQFARQVDPTHVAFIHGESSVQREILSHFESNLDADVVTRAAIRTSIPVYPPESDLVAYRTDPDAASPTITPRPEAEADEEHIVDELAASASSGNADTVASDQVAAEINAESSDDPAQTTSDSAVHIDPETLGYITDRLAAIDTELTALRNDERRSEADLRELIRDEVQAILENDD
jgi:Cft2 family RNA processing exonuclease